MRKELKRRLWAAVCFMALLGFSALVGVLLLLGPYANRVSVVNIGTSQLVDVRLGVANEETFVGSMNAGETKIWYSSSEGADGSIMLFSRVGYQQIVCVVGYVSPNMRTSSKFLVDTSNYSATYEFAYVSLFGRTKQATKVTGECSRIENR